MVDSARQQAAEVAAIAHHGNDFPKLENINATNQRPLATFNSIIKNSCHCHRYPALFTKGATSSSLSVSTFAGSRITA